MGLQVAEWTEQALGLTPNNDGPMLVVLAPRKLRLAKMVGAYTAQVYRVGLCDLFDSE